jgi:dihydroorotate dehydrogenase
MVQIYTSFGYNGVGTSRRIKDELVELLEKEGKTWDQVVKEALNTYSLKEPENKTSSMEQLVSEAQELTSFLGIGQQQQGKQEEDEGMRDEAVSPGVSQDSVV